MAQRLARIYKLVNSTKQIARFIIFGSFVTAKPSPNDVDIFMLMENSFDASQLHGETAVIFNHLMAQNYEGSSVFWIRRLAILDSEQKTIEHWQIKRDGAKRGIVEVTGL